MPDRTLNALIVKPPESQGAQATLESGEFVYCRIDSHLGKEIGHPR